MIDEKAIFSRIEMLNSIEPNAENLKLVMERVQQTLQEIEVGRKSLKANIFGIITKNKITKFAAVIVFVLFVILPLTYGAYKLISYFIIEETKHSFYFEDRFYTVTQEVSVFAEDEDEKVPGIKEIKEALRILKKGEGEQIKPGIYQVTLSNGKKIKLNLPEPFKTREELKRELGEIDRLRMAGKYERIYRPEQDFIDDKGFLNKFFEDHFTLSNGESRVIFGSEKVEELEERTGPMTPNFLGEQ